jgi:hypothetical protein
MCVENESRGWTSAWQEIAPAFDALGGLTELSFDFGGRYMTIAEVAAPKDCPPYVDDSPERLEK